MTDPRPAAIGSLWIGGYLSYLERICIQSFLDAGHPFTLYAYDEIEDPPEGVELADAREIYPDERILVHSERQSPALHSDIFRIKMIAQTGKIWADLDAYCLKPFQTRDGYLFGRIDRGTIANGVLALPPDAPVLAQLDAFLSSRGRIPPWWSQTQKDAFIESGQEPDFATMQWATTGPRALTHFLTQTGEIRHALPREVLYPVPSTAKRQFVRRVSLITQYITEETISVHFYASGIRKRLSNTKLRPGTYLYRLAQQHGISIEDYPVRAPGAAADAAEGA